MTPSHLVLGHGHWVLGNSDADHWGMLMGPITVEVVSCIQDQRRQKGTFEFKLIDYPGHPVVKFSSVCDSWDALSSVEEGDVLALGFERDGNCFTVKAIDCPSVETLSAE